MLNHALAEVEPALVGFRVLGVGLCGEDIGLAEVWTIVLGDGRPAHQLVHGEEFQEGGIGRDLLVARIAVNAVKEIGLFIIVGGEDDEVDYTLKGLERSARD